MFILTQSYKGGVKRTSTGALNRSQGFKNPANDFFTMNVITKDWKDFFAAR